MGVDQMAKPSKEVLITADDLLKSRIEILCQQDGGGCGSIVTIEPLPEDPSLIFCPVCTPQRALGAGSQVLALLVALKELSRKKKESNKLPIAFRLAVE